MADRTLVEEIASAEPAPPTTTPDPRPGPSGRQTSSPVESSSAAKAPAVFVSQANLAGDIQLELGGIAWSEHRPFVLINGKVLGAGDRVRGFTVVSIEPRQVELQSPSESLILKLK